jgi:opacity protein-like surface antigen
MGWGIRTDPCTACASPENTSSFTAHLAVAKPLHRGLGVGVDVSVWRRSHPGPFGADTALVDQPSTLVNMLVNASVTFSYEVSYLWVRGGVGPALSRTDVLEDDGSGTEIKAGASGMGVGYTLGAGVRMPLAGPISLAFFANWNAGGYDLSTARAVVARGAKHEYLELGMGIALR